MFKWKSWEQSVPVVESRHILGRQRPTLIEVIPTFTTSDRGAALAVAKTTHQDPKVKLSRHFVLDEATTFMTTPTNRVAGPEGVAIKGLVGIAVCANPVSPTTFWDVDTHAPVLKRLADLTAELSYYHGIKPRLLSREEFDHWLERPSRRRGGFYIPHAETDGFPWVEFKLLFDQKMKSFSQY